MEWVYYAGAGYFVLGLSQALRQLAADVGEQPAWARRPTARGFAMAVMLWWWADFRTSLVVTKRTLALGFLTSGIRLLSAVVHLRIIVWLCVELPADHLESWIARVLVGGVAGAVLLVLMPIATQIFGLLL